MRAESRIGANVPVSNLDEAIAFYERKLGLTLFGAATIGDTRAAWVKDRDSNILEITGA